MNAPTRRSTDFNYRLPDDLEFHPTKYQIESAARRAKGTTYRPLERPIWHPYAWLLIAVAIMVVVGGYVLLKVLGE